MPSDARDIIRKPLVTEKGTMLQEKHRQYCFLVHPDANKVQIKHAVEELFPEVRVTDVHTMIRKGKPRRTFGRPHHTDSFKRALVKLREGDHIDFF